MTFTFIQVSTIALNSSNTPASNLHQQHAQTNHTINTTLQIEFRKLTVTDLLYCTSPPPQTPVSFDKRLNKVVLSKLRVVIVFTSLGVHLQGYHRFTVLYRRTAANKMQRGSHPVSASRSYRKRCSAAPSLRHCGWLPPYSAQCQTSSAAQ